MKNLLIFITLILLMGSCGQQINNSSSTAPLNKTDIQTINKLDTVAKNVSTATTTEIIESGDTLIAKGRCAILYNPDSGRIANLKKKGKEEDFYTVADDNLWYQAESRTFLNKEGIKTVDTEKKKIVFKKINGQTIVFNTDTMESAWGLFLFDGINEPLEANTTDIEVDYKKYFKE